MGQIMAFNNSHNEMVRLDENEERKQLSRILGVIGHDLKQPVSVAMMFVEMARADLTGEKSPERLQRAYDALRQVCRELDAIVRTSQSDRAFAPRKTEVPVQVLFDRLDAEWRAYAAHFGIFLRIQPSSAVVSTDADLLMTILRNLIGNAVKFSSRGRRVVVGCRRVGGEVRFEVHDQGPGMRSDRLERMFDAFERGEQGSSTPGFGLGLHLVRETGALLGCKVAISSVQGRGTSFHVYVPKPPLNS